MKYESGKLASIAGAANEHIVLGMLLTRYPDTMLSSHQQSSHDLIINFKKSFIRAQIKTSQKSISFTGGNRAGQDRTYKKGKNNPKTYTYSSLDTDVVIGISPLEVGRYDLYFVPSLVIEKINQKSLSINKVSFTKNNFLYLENCKDEEFVYEYIKKLSE